MMMTGIEPMGLGTDRVRSHAINAAMKKSCLSNSDKPPQSSLRPHGRLLCRIIQTNDLALKLNVLAVWPCLFVGVVLLGAF